MRFAAASEAMGATRAFVVTLARPALPRALRDAAVRLTKAPDFSWHDALNLAQRSGVHGAVARHLLDERALDAPLEIRRLASACLLRLAAQEEATTRTLRPILQQLDVRGIQTVLLKGSALLGRVYSPGQRRLGDVDLLIRPNDVSAAVSTFEAFGYDTPNGPPAPRTSHQVELCRSGAMTVDLHWALVHPRGQAFTLDARRVLSRATATEGPLTPALAARCEDVFVHLCTQLLGDGGRFDLFRVADLVALLAHGLDLDDVLDEAGRARALTAVYVGTQIAERVLAPDAERLRYQLEDRVGFRARKIARLLSSYETIGGLRCVRRGTSVALLPLSYDRKRDGLRRLARMMDTHPDTRFDLQLEDGTTRARVIADAALSAGALMLGPVTAFDWHRWLTYDCLREESEP